MNINELGGRPTMYLFSDGVDELLVGLFMLFYGSASSVLEGLPKDWGYGWGGFLFPMLLGLSAFGIARGRKILRERVTSPRGGYVALKVTPYRRLVWAFLGVPGIVLVRLIVSLHSEAVVGCTVAVLGYTITGLLYRLPYMFWLAGFSLLLDIFVSVKGSDLLLVMLCQGAMLAAAGGVKLWLFVRSHPASVVAEEV